MLCTKPVGSATSGWYERRGLEEKELIMRWLLSGMLAKVMMLTHIQGRKIYTNPWIYRNEGTDRKESISMAQINWPTKREELEWSEMERRENKRESFLCYIPRGMPAYCTKRVSTLFQRKGPPIDQVAMDDNWSFEGPAFWKRKQLPNRANWCPSARSWSSERLEKMACIIYIVHTKVWNMIQSGITLEWSPEGKRRKRTSWFGYRGRLGQRREGIAMEN